MSSYSTKLPPPPLAPTSFSLRGAGLLVAIAFFISMTFMVAVIHTVGVDGIVPNQSDNGGRVLTTLDKYTPGSTPSTVLEQLNLSMSEDANRNGSVDFVISFYQGEPVNEGQFVPMDEAQEAPRVLIRGNENDAERYTYVLVDIDAPNPKSPTHAPFLHYIMVDLAVNGRTGQDKVRQQHEVVVVPYYPVTPPVGKHRYVSLLFRQTERAAHARLTVKRSKFDVATFATKHKLDLVAASSFYSHPAP